MPESRFRKETGTLPDDITTSYWLILVVIRNFFTNYRAEGNPSVDGEMKQVENKTPDSSSKRQKRQTRRTGEKAWQKDWR
jgi:sulfur relay (sulfurtransferase) DsrC/TusE family protein